MRYKIFIILILFTFFYKNINAQKKYYVNGIIMFEKKLISNCNVRVYNNNKLFYTGYSLANGYFLLKLPYNKDYQIEFSKINYFAKTLRISTYVPAGFENNIEKSEILKVDVVSIKLKNDTTIRNYQIDPNTRDLIEVTTKYVNNILLKARNKANLIVAKAEYKADTIINEAEREKINIRNKNIALQKQNDSLKNIMNSEIAGLRNSQEAMKLKNEEIKSAASDSLSKITDLINNKKGKLQSLYDKLAQARLNNDSTAILALEQQIGKLKPELDLLKEKSDSYKDIILLKDLEIKQKNTYIIAAIIVSLLILILLIIAMLLYKNKKKNNEILLQKNNELDRQKTKIEEQHDEITSSIEYASYIQNAFLKTTETIENNLDFFIYFKPKDVVSGDFYWLSEIEPSNDQIEFSSIVAAIDCTGHGVPGAFMSMLGNSLLNEIVIENKNYNPAEILKLMNEGVVKRLNQKTTKNTDGMDVALCRIDKFKDSNTLVTYAGAKRPLFIYNDAEKIMDRIKGSRRSIGGLLWKKDKFTNTTIECDKNDMLYLTSDGFADQKGVSGKRYGIKKFVKLFEFIAEKTTEEQKTIMEDEMQNFKEDLEFRDDVTVIGIKIT